MRAVRWTKGAVPRYLSLWLGMVVFTAGMTPLTSASASSPTPLVFAGSGTNLAITRHLAEAFVRTRRDVVINVPASIGSTGGIRAAADGAIAVGLVSRRLKADEQRFGLQVVPYARSAIAFGVHSTVVDDGITFDDLIKIYRGAKTRWSDGHEIVVLTRQPTDSGIEVLEREVPGFREAYAESQKAKRWLTYFTDQEMNHNLAKTRYAMGLLDVGIIQAERLDVKALRVNGVPPTEANVINRRYALVKTLAFVYRDDLLAPGAKAFFEFVRSKSGQRILRSHGYLLSE